MKCWRIIWKSIVALLLAAVLLLVILQVALRPAVLTRVVNRVAAQYTDGTLTFQEVRAHVIKSFPYLHVEARDISLTYPHSLYARYDSVYQDNGRRFSLLKAGWQRDSSATEPQDTLLSAAEMALSVDYATFLSRKELHLHKLRLLRPRIFAHYYDSSHANWHILRLGQSEPADTSQSALPPILVQTVELADRPRIVFTDPLDTLYGMFSLRHLALDGQVHLKEWDRLHASLSVDTLFVSGRLPQDTLALGVDHLGVRARGEHMSLEADARASLRTRSYGRLRVPVHLEAEGDLRLEPALDVKLERLGLRFSALALWARGNVKRVAEGWDMALDLHTDDCPIGEIFDAYEQNIPLLKKVDTDARLTLDARAQGVLGGGKVPSLTAKLRIPPAAVTLEGVSRQGRLGLDADISTRDYREVNADVSRLLLDVAGARIDAAGTVGDLLGDDPLLSVDGTVHARVDSLLQVFLRESGIRGTGGVDARIHGKVRLSQLNRQRIGGANIDCKLTARELSLQRASDSLAAYVRRLNADLATKGNTLDRNLRKGARVLALKADLDTLDLSMNGNIFVRGGDLRLLMQNSADVLKTASRPSSLMGILNVSRLRIRDNEGIAVSLRGNQERFRIEPPTQARPSPRLSLSSRSEAVRMRRETQLYGLRDLSFDVAAVRHQRPSGRNMRGTRMPDSLRRSALSRRPRQDDFASADVNISLSGALREYVRDWDFAGNLALGSARMAFPSFPLRTSLSGVKGRICNDTLQLHQLTLRSGASDLTASARLTGLRRALLGRGRGRLKLDATVQSEFLDASELMRAYAYHTTYQPPERLESASDEALEAAVEGSELASEARSSLLVVPSNLEVNLTLESHGIHYDSLEVSWASADIAMRDRTLQITNALAASNMGDLYFEGFYATRSRTDIRAGFDLNLVDITAEKVITLFPAVDTILPMLTSFGGDLDCELAATADVDTNMNLILPSIDGIMKISGKDLTLKDSEEFSKIAGMLLFRDKEKAVVDNMAVTGMIRDNILEVFPFVLDVDRYTVAASGLQHLDASFKYHLSVIRSPLLFKFGLNAWGQDFDHIQYALSKPLYKDAHVPVFTRQLDTVQYSLVAAIHNVFELGVDRAIAQNNEQHYIQDRQDQLGWRADDAAADTSLELRDRSALMAEVSRRITDRREVLRQEILRLEAEAARQRKQEEDYEQ